MSITTFKAGIDADIIAKQGIPASVPATRLGQAWKDLADETVALFSALNGGVVPTDYDTVFKIGQRIIAINNLLGTSGKTIDQLVSDINGKDAGTVVDGKISAAINALINGAPGAIDTLNELATAMGNDPNFATTMTNALAGKEPSIGAKGTAFNKDFGTGSESVARGNHTHNTDAISESGAPTNKWWTNARTITAVLTGYVKAVSASALAATDTVSSAFGKVEKRLDDFVASLSGKADLVDNLVNPAQLPLVEFNGEHFVDNGTAPDQLISIQPALLGGGTTSTLRSILEARNYQIWQWMSDTTARPVFGTSNATTGTPNAEGYTTASWIGKKPRWAIDSATTAGAVAAVRQGQAMANLGDGFDLSFMFMNADPAAVANARLFYGLQATSGDIIGSGDPSALVDIIAIANNSADVNLQIMHNDGAGTATKIDLGANFPANTRSTDVYGVRFTKISGQLLTYEVKRFSASTGAQVGATASGSITSNLPADTQKLYVSGIRSNGPTALPVTLVHIGNMILDWPV